MSSPIDDRFANATPRPRFDPYTGEPLAGEHTTLPPAFQQPPQHVRDTLPPSNPIPRQPANQYAPTGWAGKARNQFDLQLPSGQVALISMLERDDIVRLQLMTYLDTLTPLLMSDSISQAERDRQVKSKIETDPNAIQGMFAAVDKVVMAVTIRPRVTEDQDKADYGTPADWANPNFIATAWLHDIDMDDRFAIFAAAFGRSMDDLKSFRDEANSVASVAAESGVQPTPE